MAADVGWRRWAACRQADTQLFFPGGATGVHAEQAAQAKAICSGCPVAGRCLAFAVETNQWHGVWGGLTQEERDPVRREWRRARRA